MTHGRAVTATDTFTSSERAALKRNVTLWAGMLAIVALEVAVTWMRPAMPTLTAMLLALALIQATLGVLYFMHLRHERAVLGWSLIAALVFVLGMMNQVWPDALRVFRLRLHQ